MASDVDYEAELRAARETIQAQDEQLKELTAAPWELATIAAASEHEGQPTFILAGSSGMIETMAPSGLNLSPSDKVRVNPITNAIVALATTEGHGAIATVEKVRGDLLEASMDGQTRLVYRGKTEPEKGERVVLDFTGTVAVANLGRDEERFRFEGTSGVCWDDIGGLQGIKEQMRAAIEIPHEHPELYERYNKKPIAGVLLYGPAGVGKTMLGKATSTALAEIFGASQGGFFYVKGPEILNMYVGNSEAAICQLFERCRRFKEDAGHPAVLFIDEAESILGRRGTGISSDMEKTIVPMFLAEMDGLETSGALVILATNRQDTLDPAVVREGRIDRHIRVPRPDKNAARDIFTIYLKNLPTNGATHGELACVGSEALFDIGRNFGSIQTVRGRLPFTLGQIVHGGMVENIVDRATDYAIARDLEGKRGAKTGLTPEDMTRAVDHVFIQNRDLDHKDAKRELDEALAA